MYVQCMRVVIKYNRPYRPLRERFAYSNKNKENKMKIEKIFFR